VIERKCIYYGSVNMLVGICLRFRLWVFNATSNNVFVVSSNEILHQHMLVTDKIIIENHRYTASHWYDYHGKPPTYRKSLTKLSLKTTDLSQINDKIIIENHRPIANQWQNYHWKPPTYRKSLIRLSWKTTDLSQITDKMIMENHRPTASHWQNYHVKPPTYRKSLTKCIIYNWI
jgi:hypothetical protein